jgi:ceramide glucosyltransferase
MHPLVLVILACSGVASAYQLVQLVAAWRFLRRTPAPLPAGAAHCPPVTVLKPLKGPGVELAANLESFCRQDYPVYQVVFGVDDARDPAVEVVRGIMRRFPHLDIALAIGHEEGANRKVANLVHMMRHAKHEVLVVSDADIRVRVDYLRTMVAPLADPTVGLTTCLYRGHAVGGFPAVVESLLVGTDFLPMVLMAQWVQRFKYAYGASIAFRRDALDAIGGFEDMRAHLADDYLLGRRIAEAGWTLRLLPYVVETIPDSPTWRDVWRHHLRWARTYRVCQPIGWFATIIIQTMLWGVLAVLATGGAAIGWLALAMAVLCRLVSLRAIAGLFGDTDTVRHLWLVPVKDLAYSGVWLASWLGRDIDWSGQRLRVLPDGRMVSIGKETPVAAPKTSESPALSRGPATRARRSAAAVRAGTDLSALP